MTMTKLLTTTALLALLVGIIFAAMYEPPKYRPLFPAAGEIIWDCDMQSLKTKRGEAVADCIARVR